MVFRERAGFCIARTVGIGIQDFETIIANDYFYVDKTSFIKESGYVAEIGRASCRERV